jgi:hypothetical protein
MPNFAALEQRLNRVAVSHLANATVAWRSGAAGGVWVTDLRVVFARQSSPGLEGLVNDANPVLAAFEGVMPEAARGDLVDVTLDSTGQTKRFEVVRASPDGTGLLVLHLIDEGSL